MTTRHATFSQAGSVVGVLLILIGVVQILALLTHGQMAPILLVGVGAFLLWQAFRDKNEAAVPGGEGAVADVAVLGQIRRELPPTLFRGGRVTSVLGGAALDLRHVTFGSEPVLLEVVAVMGQIELKVPAGCAVDLRVSPVMGEVDSRLPEPARAGRAAQIVVSGCVVMGSVRVSN